MTQTRYIATVAVALALTLIALVPAKACEPSRVCYGKWIDGQPDFSHCTK